VKQAFAVWRWQHLSFSLNAKHRQLAIAIDVMCASREVELAKSRAENNLLGVRRFQNTKNYVWQYA